jgi:hypothetical protein
MSHPPARVARRHFLVRPQIAAADGGATDLDQRVGRLDQAGVRNGLDPNVAGRMQDGSAHGNERTP